MGDTIDWTDGTDKVTEHFTVQDACMLHHWNRLATADDGMDPAKLQALCEAMEKVRDVLGCPMNVHCMFRSPAYNVEIGAPEHDVHSQNLACDFDCGAALTIQQVKDKLEPLLESMGLRMERGTTSWVHVDTHPVGNARYFNP